jgi:hypothetical protein
MLESENAFYALHQTEFHEKYQNKWLVIIGESLWGVFDTLRDAAQNALEHFEPGEFMIHTPAHDGMVIEIGPNIHTQYPDCAKNEKTKSVMTVSSGDLVAFPYA